ncbi:hypothetical protein NC651_018441 [Populus alba x Populus x berolinensis]|nr:hypothetical protein NC651_018441 [Populus alba x Populus x berolinensis]
MEFFKAVQGHLVTMGLDLKRVHFQAKIYWTTCRLRLFLLSDTPHLWIVIVQKGGAQVKILGVEEIGDLVQGNAARPPRVMGRNKLFAGEVNVGFSPS